MSEVLQRKEKINSAIIAHDPAALAESLMGWLEATAYLRVLPNLDKLALPRGAIPSLSSADLKEEAIRYEADDTMMAFCISAGLHEDPEALATLHSRLTKEMGPLYPGSSAVAHCIQVIDPIVTLDDAVGQRIKAMLEGKALDPKDIWNSGLRLLQRLRACNFVQELSPLLARWLRARWSGAIVAQRFNLTRPRENIPAIEAVLANPADDQAFIASLLLASSDATGMEIASDCRAQLETIAGPR
jgi:hypothetical protein